MDIEKINYTDDKTLGILKNTVAKGTTTEEFELFRQFCMATGLNPFKKEIWCIKAGGAVQMLTGINGFYTIANRNPLYDGIETELVEANGKIVKSISKVYRKDRSRPQIAEAHWEEYNKGHGNWKTMPRVMLNKCSEAMALRKAFPQELDGLYVEEEMPGRYENPVVNNPKMKVIHEATIPEIPDSESGLYRYCFKDVTDVQLAWLKENVFPNIEHSLIPDAEMVYEFIQKLPYPQMNKFYVKEKSNEPV